MHPTCGKILPPNETYVKPGHYVYEFYSPTKQKPNYKRYPGFQENSHPDGYCLPCCFDFHNTPGVTQVKNRCLGKAPETKANIEEDEYVKGPEKFPLETGRWGYLPIGIQKLLREDNSKCQISNKSKKLKVGHPCLLRHGIEINEKQSFLACLSDIIFYGKTPRVPSIEQFKRLLMKAITVDEFIKYQNGNLVTKFYKPTESPDISKQEGTVLFSKLNMDKPEDKSYYQKVVSAFENFRRFINDKDSVIDHTYLWDIVSMPNKLLFAGGVNLVILQLPNSDITNNVQIICPTNHYSNELFESRKPTIFIMKVEQYYEPLYSYTDNKKKTNVEKDFKESDKKTSESMKNVLREVIQPFFDTICRPLAPGTRTNVFTSTKPLLLGDLIKKLDLTSYKTNKLVVNYNNKVIGVIAESRTQKTGFVPCYPSAINESLKKDLDYVFMTDPSLWKPYNATIEFLRKLNTNSITRVGDGQGIPCKPMFKIIEDELVVGILTETNQFIQLSEPIAEDEIKINEDIPAIKNDNYIVDVKETPMVSADIQIASSSGVDKDRISTINKIKMESNFYNVFRNTIRILLTDYKNTEQREKIESHMNNQGVIYSNKINEIDTLLRTLVDDSIQFIGDDKYFEKISEISTCIIKDPKSCSNSPRLCAVTSDGNCDLILPKHNLITKKENESIYFRRMSDELIRYSRIKSFMLKPQTYLSFGNIGYNLSDNEIIMMQSLLTKEYFDGLVPDTINNYVNYNTRDDAKPNFSRTYENKVTVEEKEEEKEEEKKEEDGADVCERKIKGWITSTLWKKAFPSSFKEKEYENCSFEIIIDLLEKHNGTKTTVNQIKDDLTQEYETKYLGEFKDKIVDILISEGKIVGQQVRNGSVNLSDWIHTEKYYLTPLDMWVLVRKYEIPTIFISQQTIMQSGYKENVFVGYDGISDNYAFIVIPILKTEKTPNYKLIMKSDGEIFVNPEQMIDSSKVKEAIISIVTPDEYLTAFTKEQVEKPIRARKQKLIIDSSSEKASSSSTVSFEIPIPVDKKKRKTKKLIVKNNNATKNARGK